MKVVCIDDGEMKDGTGISFLTIGKVYDAFGHTLDVCKVKDDQGQINWFRTERFVYLNEVRNDKIDQILL